MVTAAPVRIAIVVGEASGDQLGAGLMKALREHYPEAVFEGLGGPRMIAEGFHSLYPMERLAVMGLVEPLKRLPELLRMRRALKQYFLAWQPAVMVGIDAPDFNLGLELQLRRAGLKTAHYVSPSVWAWRQGRVKKIARAVDLMLTLLPFEAEFYRTHQVPVAYVGHPMADELPLVPDPLAARRTLRLPATGPLLAVLPGSRRAEVALLGPLFLAVARWCWQRWPGLTFVLPAASPERRRELDVLLEGAGDLPIKVLDGQSHTAMEAADVVLLASGTTALEAMLLKKPMVVAYRVGWLTHLMLAPMLKIPHVSLPNLLAGHALVPELLQNDATVERIGAAVLGYLQDPRKGAALQAEFLRLHRELSCGGSAVAAAALADLIESSQ
ncbi:MAG: lipid-A-disaccharide synthase [Porticoccaceae bacterium]